MIKGMDHLILCSTGSFMLCIFRPIRTSGVMARWRLWLVLEMFQCYRLSVRTYGVTHHRGYLPDLVASNDLESFWTRGQCDCLTFGFEHLP